MTSTTKYLFLKRTIAPIPVVQYHCAPRPGGQRTIFPPSAKPSINTLSSLVLSSSSAAQHPLRMHPALLPALPHEREFLVRWYKWKQFN
jgi:hypothetical protein